MIVDQDLPLLCIRSYYSSHDTWFNVLVDSGQLRNQTYFILTPLCYIAVHDAASQVGADHNPTPPKLPAVQRALTTFLFYSPLIKYSRIKKWGRLGLNQLNMLRKHIVCLSIIAVCSQVVERGIEPP